MFLLRVVAKRVDDGPDERQPKSRQGGRIPAHAFLLEDVALHHGPAGAAMLHRPRRRAPAARIQDAVPAEHAVLADPLARLHLARDILRQIGADEVAYLSLKTDVSV